MVGRYCLAAMEHFRDGSWLALDISERGRSVVNITFYASDKPREIMLAKALAEGAKALGDYSEIRRTADYGEDEEGNDKKFPGPSPETDVACIFGVKGRSKDILKDHRLVGKATLYFDKGYTRAKGEGGHTLHSRISVNAAHPCD